MSDRAFRTQESLEAEHLSRRVVNEFLQERGFEIQEDQRERRGQTVIARALTGERLAIRVKLGWRRASEREGSHLAYSAVQLLARVRGEDWLGSIEGKLSREVAHGVTHMLFVQRDGPDITHAAMVPVSAVGVIWRTQRDVYDRLLAGNQLGRRTKNPALNGRSPTLWLQDDRGGNEAVAVLWNHPATVDLNDSPVVGTASPFPEEVAESEIYHEGARRKISVNVYERDRRARARCIEHHGSTCCICGFDFRTAYGLVASGYIHVHHLEPLAAASGVRTVDPVKDLRPVCPNCHAIIHLNGSIRTLEEVKAMLSSARKC